MNKLKQEAFIAVIPAPKATELSHDVLECIKTYSFFDGDHNNLSRKGELTKGLSKNANDFVYERRLLVLYTEEAFKEGELILELSSKRLGAYFHDTISNTHDIISGNTTYPFTTPEYFRKVLAVNDEHYGLPMFSDHFITKFVDRWNVGLPIFKVVVATDGEAVITKDNFKVIVDEDEDSTNIPIEAPKTWADIEKEVSDIWFAKNLSDRCETFNQFFLDYLSENYNLPTKKS